MTVLAGFSASSHGLAPLHLGAQLARSAGGKLVAASLVERPWPPKSEPTEREYLSHLTGQVKRHLDAAVATLPDDVDTWAVTSESESIPTGLANLAVELGAEVVAVGSSSTGLLGRVALGSVTDSLVHHAHVPVAIAPRGYPAEAGPIRRLSVAYGGNAAAVGLIASSAELAQRWSARLRIVSFRVRPLWVGIEPGGEDLVVQQWLRRTTDEISKQLNDVRARIPVPDVDVVIGQGHDWQAAVEDVSWTAGDILLLGSGAAGAKAQVLLSSAASKILRRSPVPVMILPAQ